MTNRNIQNHNSTKTHFKIHFPKDFNDRLVLAFTIWALTSTIFGSLSPNHGMIANVFSLVFSGLTYLVSAYNTCNDKPSESNLWAQLTIIAFSMALNFTVISIMEITSRHYAVCFAIIFLLILSIPIYAIYHVEELVVKKLLKFKTRNDIQP